MKILVYGAGNTGFAICRYLQVLGEDVCLYSRSADKAKRYHQQALVSERLLPGQFQLRVHSDLPSALSEVQLVIVSTEARAHREALELIDRYAPKDSIILVFNGNWAVFEYRQGGGERSVLESSAQPFIASFADGTLKLQSIKERVGIASCDKRWTEAVVKQLRGIFPQLFALESIVESSMGGTNPIIHVPIVLSNLSRIENGESFYFYAEGTSRRVVEIMLELDRERMVLARALGYELQDILAGINSFFSVKHEQLYDALKQNQTYQTVLGPQTMEHRYITEDIPYGIYPVLAIARSIGIACPATEALMSYCRLIFGEDRWPALPEFQEQAMQDYLMRRP